MGRKLTKDREGFWAVHETVSDNETAVTPKFKKKEEVSEYLQKYGDFWMQKKNEPGLPKDIADLFIEVGFVPTAAMGSYGFLHGYYCLKLHKKYVGNDDEG